MGMKTFLKVCNFICSLGCALTYITLSKDLWMVAATYGFVSAFGQNIALIPTLTTAMKWFPNRKGKCIESCTVSETPQEKDSEHCMFII